MRVPVVTGTSNLLVLLYLRVAWPRFLGHARNWPGGSIIYFHLRFFKTVFVLH
jgi:hypothetical protein